jgi:hypothetical protein
METIIVEAFTDYHFGANWSLSNPYAHLDVRNLNNNMLAIHFLFLETTAFLKIA